MPSSFRPSHMVTPTLEYAAAATNGASRDSSTGRCPASEPSGQATAVMSDSIFFLRKLYTGCSTTGKPTRSFATESVSLDSV
jgi:hypothetical protein